MRADKQKKVLKALGLRRYFATENGDIFSCLGRVERRLRASFLPKGYAVLGLQVSPNEQVQCLVHQVVYLQFRGAFDSRLEIDHINGNKADNRLNNLQAVTPLENVSRAVKLGLVPRGTQHYLAKLGAADVRRIRRLVANGAVQAHLAREYGVSTGTIRDLLQRKTWRHV